MKAARSTRAVSSGIRLAKSGRTEITRARSPGRKWLAQTSRVSRMAAATRRALAGLLPCTELMKPRIIKGLSRTEAARRAEQLLDYMQIGKRANSQGTKLSGGEQQRVAIARSRAYAPLVLLADEPTGNLDPVTASYVFEALAALVKQSGLAALIATHNHELASRMDRRVTLADGKVVPLGSG